MRMLESYASLRQLNHQALADLLVGLIADIRQVLIHPEMGNAAKITAMFAIVDTAAPPPPPDPPSRASGPPGAGGPGRARESALSVTQLARPS